MQSRQITTNFAKDVKMIRPCSGLVALSVAIVFVTAGCGQFSAYHKRGLQNSACPEVYGVDDPVFHGYKKTFWRSWPEETWDCAPADGLEHGDLVFPSQTTGACLERFRKLNCQQASLVKEYSVTTSP